jgi:hypothetical protein
VRHDADVAELGEGGVYGSHLRSLLRLVGVPLANVCHQR